MEVSRISNEHKGAVIQSFQCQLNWLKMNGSEEERNSAMDIMERFKASVCYFQMGDRFTDDRRTEVLYGHG